MSQPGLAARRQRRAAHPAKFYVSEHSSAPAEPPVHRPRSRFHPETPPEGDSHINPRSSRFDKNPFAADETRAGLAHAMYQSFLSPRNAWTAHAAAVKIQALLRGRATRALFRDSTARIDGLVGRLFRWFDGNDNGLVEEQELLPSEQADPRLTAIVLELLGQLPPTDTPGCDLLGFGLFLKGAVGMLFDHLDVDGSGALEDSELSWARSAFNCHIAAGAPLSRGEFLRVFLELSTSTAMLSSGGFREVLFSLLTLLHGFRMKEGAHQHPLGAVAVQHHLDHTLRSLYRASVGCALFGGGLDHPRLSLPEGPLHQYYTRLCPELSWTQSPGLHCTVLPQASFHTVLLHAMRHIHRSPTATAALLLQLPGQSTEQGCAMPESSFACVVAARLLEEEGRVLERIVGVLQGDEEVREAMRRAAQEMATVASAQLAAIEMDSTAARFATSW